ncbi:MAG: alpha/beta hydrolase [Chitinophagales bacterium]|nr:alpha/beta hydrolase [Hyphomicrobiales bacterium]
MSLFFTPRRSPIREDERSVLMHALRFSFDVEGKRVQGYSWGAGPVILLAHGWQGNAGHMTAFVKPLVRAGFRAVAIDMPAHGKSEGRKSSIVHFAAAIEAAAELFGPLRGLIGHSGGAAAGANAMARHLPVRLAVLIAPPARLETFLTRFASRLGLPEAVIREMTMKAERWLKTQFENVSPVRSARSVTVPVLVIHAPEDAMIAFDEGAEVASNFVNGAFMSAPGMGHMRILKDWRTISHAVEFLQGGGQTSKAVQSLNRDRLKTL